MPLATISADHGPAAAVMREDSAAVIADGVLRPILHPSAVVCVGLNYGTHILEMGRELPKHPTYLGTLARALTDPNRDIALPPASQRVDYEQWFAGKNWERSTPVRPAIVTVDELAPFEPSKLRVTVNGGAPGTPAGVGDAMEPRRYLADGDVVEITIDGLGTLQDTFRQESC